MIKILSDGVNAFMSKKRDYDVIEPRITERYKEAKEYIKENFVSNENHETIIPKKYLYDKAYESKKYVILDRKKLENG